MASRGHQRRFTRGFLPALAASVACIAIYPAAAQTPVFNQNAADQTTKSEWPKRAEAPRGAPNVLIILLDDVGFGAASTFGGVAETPALDKLAGEGLRYNNFHTTAVCSQTRAALLTGRNHHRVGFGTVSGMEAGFPGYHGVWPASTASIAEVLRKNGYSTAAFGKWHNTPTWETSPVGPFDRWPTGLGFEYFYGFNAGEASQYEPILIQNTVPVSPAKTPDQGYHFTTDIADNAISWLRTQRALAPNRPYMVYFAPGATHAPIQVPREWIDRYRGKFDAGWDRLRQETFERQKRLGVIPRDTVLTPRPDELPAWDSLTSDQKRLYSKQMEAYAAFLAHTDHEVGRLIDEVRREPGGENTVVMYIVGDNGASSEGGLDGSDNNLVDMFANTDKSRPASVSGQLTRIDTIGSPAVDNHYATGWAWAMTTPFQWMKQVASHFGGTRNPLVVSWQARIRAKGEVRSQFTHVNDVVPTLYELIGITAPETVYGVEQKSVDGVSFAYSFTQSDGRSQHRRQYFMTNANRAIYEDGWVAASRHGLPWILGQRASNLDGDRWELYHVDRDFSEARNLAAKMPEKLEQMKALFESEARRNDVFPILTGLGVMRDAPSLTAGRTSFRYLPGVWPIPSLSGGPLTFGSHRITARIVMPPDGGDGVIIANGGRHGGYTLYVKDRHLVYENNAGSTRHDVIRSEAPLPAGEMTVVYEFDAGAARGSGTGILSVNGQPVATGHIAGLGFPSYLDALCIGKDCGSPVSNGYEGPFAFTGSIDHVQIDLLGSKTAGRSAH